MSCTRTFEAEAMRDGRLGDVERASYERHLATCRACADEVAALAVLAERLRTEAGAPADELRARRERTRLLGAFDAARVAPPPARARWWLAAAVVVALVFVLARPKRAPPPPPSAHADIHAEGDAVWSAHDNHVVLERGALAVKVTHPTPGAGITIALPDGELEDTGTIFTVRVDDGRTTEVSVAEGSVVLKLRGRPDVVLAAGERWTRTVPPPPPSVDPATSATIAITPLPVRRVDSASEYRAAVDAFDHGDNARAASAFGAFVEKHPTDAHAEDAAYLRVLALQRSGDIDATRAAAASYLDRFPTGFRRAEIERLAE